MLNAVWVAVIAAAGCFMILAAVSVYVLLKLAGLIGRTSAAVSGLRERSDEAIDRAHAAIDAATGQLARTEEITASMDEVTADMADLTGRVTALAPLARLAAASGSRRLARVPALLYGVRHAAQLRAATSAARTAGEAGRARVPAPNQRSRGVAGGRPPGPAPALEGRPRTGARR